MKRPYGWKTTLRFGDPRPNTPEYPQDGKVFHGYQYVHDGIREGWVTPQRLEEIRAGAKARARAKAEQAGRRFVERGVSRKRRLKESLNSKPLSPSRPLVRLSA
jgi:hypothetical protein